MVNVIVVAAIFVVDNVRLTRLRPFNEEVPVGRETMAIHCFNLSSKGYANKMLSW
jgi:hypothetical protein